MDPFRTVNRKLAVPELTARRWEAVLNSLSLEVSAHAAALAELVTAESLFGRILVVEVCGSLDMGRVDGTVGLPEVKEVVVERPRKGGGNAERFAWVAAAPCP